MMILHSIRYRVAVMILGLIVGAGPAVANPGGRVALVIGNGSYTGLKPLPNPRNDAAAVARTLRELGYQLIGRDGRPADGALLNLDQEGLIEAVDAFAQAARGQEIAFLYYAGHGFQDGVSSYLVPVDVPKPKQSLEILKSRSLALDGVMGKIDGKAQLVVAVFDACREIPELDAVVERSRSSGLSSDGGQYQGLIPVRGGIRQGAATTGRLIAYAGAAGQLVKDGAGQHSPYTELLLNQLKQRMSEQQNVELTAFFQDVAWAFKSRQEGQRPLLEVDAKPGTFYLLPGPVVIAPVAVPAPVVDYDLKHWESVERCGSAACFRAYLKDHPQGRFVTLAKAQIDRLIPPATPASVAPVPDPNETARQEKLDFQLTVAEKLLAQNRIPAARQALRDAKPWDRQGRVEAFRREQTLILQSAALALLQQGKRNAAQRIVNDLKQWDPESAEYRALRQQMAGK